MTDLIERLRKDLWPNDDAVQIKKCGLLREAATALESAQAEIDRLREALAFYADPKIYESHPHGPAFDRRDLSFHAIAALNKQESQK